MMAILLSAGDLDPDIGFLGGLGHGIAVASLKPDDRKWFTFGRKS